MSSSSHKAARRTFIKGLAAVPAVLSFSDLLAAEANTAHQALVIGNSAYDGMALPNPANDAQAMSGLLGRAGFTIDSHINAPRADMMKAMDRFADTILRSETKLAILYYAGHGVQGPARSNRSSMKSLTSVPNAASSPSSSAAPSARARSPEARACRRRRASGRSWAPSTSVSWP